MFIGRVSAQRTAIGDVRPSGRLFVSVRAIKPTDLWPLLSVCTCDEYMPRRELKVEVTGHWLESGPDLSMWRPWARSLLEAPTHPQML